MSEQPEGPGWWEASDGKWYPPQTQPPATAGPPPRPHSKQGTSTAWKGWLAAVLGCGGLLVVLVIIGVAYFVVLVGRDLEQSQRDYDREWEEARSDVQITRCYVDADGLPRFEVEVTNSSSETSDYQMSIEIDSPSEEFLGSPFVGIQDLEPDESASRSEEGQFTTASGSVTCDLGYAERSASRLR